MERADFLQSGVKGTAEYKVVVEVADLLYRYLEKPDVSRAIALANLPGRPSSEVQNVFLEYARQLGFEDESNGLFARYPVKALRPDYFRAIGDTGVLIEVERGKTTINNMDLLDFWKCHICDYAHYLILLVPRELRQNAAMAPRREFNTVRNRLSSFFDEPNYTNVRGLFLFGY